MSYMSRPWGVTCLLVLVLGAAPALAGPPDGAAPEADAATKAANLAEAREAFKLAREHYKSGRFDQALLELKRSYGLKKLPVLLRYIGDCYLQLKQYEEALTYYTRYVKRLPTAKDLDEVKEEMGVLRKVLQEQRAKAYAGRKVPVRLMPTGADWEDPVARRHTADRARPGQAAPPQRDETTLLGVAKWVVAGLGLAGLAVGVTFNRLAAAKADDLRKSLITGCPQADIYCPGNPNLDRPVVTFSKDHLQAELEVEQYNEVAISTLVIGGALVAGSAALFVLDWMGRKSSKRKVKIGSVSAAPLAGPGTVGLVGEVRF